MAISPDLRVSQGCWFQGPPNSNSNPEPAAGEEGPSDLVEAGHHDSEMLAMQDLRNFSRARCRVAPAEPPLPSEVQLPETNSQPVAPKPKPECTGKAPLPRKLDVHSVVSGKKVAQAARDFVGTDAHDLTGKLRGFADLRGVAGTRGGTNNQCANFVSAFAQRLGLKGHYNSVPLLQAALEKQGWTKVSGQIAKPGDVWLDGFHTELVTGAASGGQPFPTVTGSNNNRRSYQTVSSHLQRGGAFYTRPVWREQS